MNKNFIRVPEDRACSPRFAGEAGKSADEWSSVQDSAPRRNSEMRDTAAVRPQSFIFRMNVKWEKDKIGILRSSLKPTITISTPPEFKGPNGYWSPEELFLASINSCIMTTFIYFSEKFSLAFVSYESGIEGEVSFEEGKLTFSSVTIRPVIEVKSETDKEKAKQLIEKSEKYCLISSSVKSRIILSAKIEVKTD